MDAVDIGRRDVNVGVEVLASFGEFKDAAGTQAVELNGQLEGLVEVDSSGAVKNDVSLIFADGGGLRAQTKFVERNISLDDLYIATMRDK